jgi:hypothetical protein
MSIAAMNWALDLPEGAVNSSQCLLLLVLANYADEEGKCWPSQATLRQKGRQSERTIRDLTKQLVEMGALKVEKRHLKSTRYELQLNWPQKRVPAESAGKPHPKKPSPKSAATASNFDNSSREAEALPAKSAGSVLPADSDNFDRQISPKGPADFAAKPPENHQRTIREGGASARQTPLPPNWQPGEAGEAYARRLGLDPAPLAARFRKTFLANGRRLVDWSQRWELWCDEDAAEKGSATPTAAPNSAAPSIERDERGLTSSDRGWLAKWQAKIDADEHPGQLEETLRRMLSQEGKAELARLKAALSQTPAKGAEIFRPSQPERGNIFTRP